MSARAPSVRAAALHSVGAVDVVGWRRDVAGGVETALLVAFPVALAVAAAWRAAKWARGKLRGSAERSRSAQLPPVGEDAFCELAGVDEA